MQVIRNLFRKNRFQEGDILYLQRQDRRTLIYLADGRIITTYEPLKNVMTELSSDVFESINKGIVINHAFVDRDVDGYVLLRDGSGFARRKKPLKKPEQETADSQKGKLERNLSLISGPGIRCILADSDRQIPERSSEWTENGTFRETAVFDTPDGIRIQVEFDPSDTRVFKPVRPNGCSRSE